MRTVETDGLEEGRNDLRIRKVCVCDDLSPSTEGTDTTGGRSELNYISFKI